MERNDIDQIIDNIAAIRIAMLTTKGEDGHLHSRPMYTLEIDDQDRLWFYTEKGTLKTQEIEKQHLVNVAYADMHTHTYISLSGKAYELHDKKRMQELWDPVLESWFPDGPNADNLQLLVVEMEVAAFWDSEDSKMKTGIYFSHARSNK